MGGVIVTPTYPSRTLLFKFSQSRSGDRLNLFLRR